MDFMTNNCCPFRRQKNLFFVFFRNFYGNGRKERSLEVFFSLEFCNGNTKNSLSSNQKSNVSLPSFFFPFLAADPSPSSSFFLPPLFLFLLPTMAMTGKMDWSALAKQLQEGDTAQRIQIVNEIRERIDVVYTQEYEVFLRHLFPVFCELLRKTIPVQTVEGPEQRLRNFILETLNRLPINEVLRRHANELLKLAMFLLEKENEDNAIICLRIIIDLHKSYQAGSDSHVQQFFDVVFKIYSELPEAIKTIFGEAGQPPRSPNQLIPGMRSFKVLTDCPIIVVIFFQLYSKSKKNIPKLMQPVLDTLNTKAPPHAIENKQGYTDFITTQVKTLSFLAYLVRMYPKVFASYQSTIPKAVISILSSCPNDAVPIRKELLVATRHILASSLFNGFLVHIDTLLSESVLIGTSRTCKEALRPLAYSALADLVHHVRMKLKFEQLSSVVSLYCRNMHDPTLPYPIQTLSAKLLQSLVDCVSDLTKVFYFILFYFISLLFFSSFFFFFFFFFFLKFFFRLQVENLEGDGFFCAFLTPLSTNWVTSITAYKDLSMRKTRRKRLRKLRPRNLRPRRMLRLLLPLLLFLGLYENKPAQPF